MSPFNKSIILIPVLLVTAAVHCGEHDQATEIYKQPPEYSGSRVIIENGDTLSPTKLELLGDTLFVSYFGRHKIDIFALDFQKTGSIYLVGPEPIFPTSFTVTDSFIIVSDHAKNAVIIFDRGGAYRESFGFLPDNKTRLTPFDLTYYGGVLYLSDIGLGKILAISMADADGVTEIGELILSIPSKTDMKIGFPASAYVTFEGRLFVGDAGNNVVKTFTCDGRYIYDFDSVSVDNPFSPAAFAVDGKIDPSMQDTASFDPSGIRRMGRIHVADPGNSTVHMFNPVGKYVSSYEKNEEMQKPSDLAISRKSKKIFIADPRAKRIFIYSYEDN